MRAIANQHDKLLSEVHREISGWIARLDQRHPRQAVTSIASLQLLELTAPHPRQAVTQISTAQ
jgi:hypothetical protein